MKGSGRCEMILNGGFLKSPLWISWVFTIWIAAWNPVSISDAAEATDDFIQGYATAIVAMSYPGQVGSIQVKNGVVYVEQSRSAGFICRSVDVHQPKNPLRKGHKREVPIILLGRGYYLTKGYGSLLQR